MGFLKSVYAQSEIYAGASKGVCYILTHILASTLDVADPECLYTLIKRKRHRATARGRARVPCRSELGPEMILPLFLAEPCPDLSDVLDYD